MVLADDATFLPRRERLCIRRRPNPTATPLHAGRAIPLVHRARRFALVLFALVVMAPAAQACSWYDPKIAAVTWTENGMFFLASTELRRGDERQSESVARLGPFSSYHAAPDGQTAYYAIGVGGVGGDCTVPYRIIERWTPEGTVNVTDLLGELPMAIHWPTMRGVYRDAAGAIIRDIRTGDDGVQLLVAHSAGGIEHFGASRAVRSAAWSPDGTKIALVTDDSVWMFRDDGRYVADSFPSFSQREAMLAFSPDGRTLAVAWGMGDRFTEVRLLDVEHPDGVRYTGGYVDVRALHALAYSPNGTLALALQERPLYADMPWGNSSLLFFAAGLELLGSIQWEAQGFTHRSLSWSPDGDALVVVVDRSEERRVGERV